MATPHPENWETVLTQAKCELYTIDATVHAAVFYNPQQNKWKVLYFSFGDPEGDPPFRYFIWDTLQSTVAKIVKLIY